MRYLAVLARRLWWRAIFVGRFCSVSAQAMTDRIVRRLSPPSRPYRAPNYEASRSIIDRIRQRGEG